MRDREQEAGALLWTRGEMVFRVQAADRMAERIVHIRRPFALVGSAADADITIGGRGVSDPHVYLHLDHRGVYAIDLVTRTGTQFSDTNRSAGWLRPGHWFEVAGRRVELLRTRIDGPVDDSSPGDADLLADTSQTTLVGVTVKPQRTAGYPWVLNSELVFAGWSDACGIPVKDRAVARTHIALLRTPIAAYVVDLCGHHTWIDDQPVRGASIIHDRQILTLGSVKFFVSVKPAARSELLRDAPSSFVAPRVESPEILEPTDLTALEALPAESRGALLAWMMGTVQGSQGEALRQQGEFVHTLARLLHQMQEDNATLFAAQLARIENTDRELTSLRAEIERRRAETALSLPATLSPPPPPTPLAIPLRIPRSTPETKRSRTSTTWLLQRIRLLESRNHSAWREFLGRLALRPHRAT